MAKTAKQELKAKKKPIGKDIMGKTPLRQRIRKGQTKGGTKY